MFAHFVACVVVAQLSWFSNGHVFYKTIQMDCAPNPEFIRNATCKLKPINWYKSVSNMECEIVNELKNVTLHFQTLVKNFANQYKPFIINSIGNLCDVLDKKRFPAITKLIVDMLKTISNVNHSCPYKGRLIAKDVYLKEKMIPVVLPIGTYRALFNFYEGYPFRNIGTLTFDIQVIEKRKLRSNGSDPSQRRG